MQPTDRPGQGSAQLLRIVASPDQDLILNSSQFDVTPGAMFTCTSVAQVPPASTGSSAFLIGFVDADRRMIPAEPLEMVVLTHRADGSSIVIQGNTSL